MWDLYLNTHPYVIACSHLTRAINHLSSITNLELGILLLVSDKRGQTTMMWAVSSILEL